MAEPALVQVRVGAVEVGRDGVLEEGVPDGLESLEVDGVVGFGHGEGLKDEGRRRARVLLQVGLEVEAETAR